LEEIFVTLRLSGLEFVDWWGLGDRGQAPIVGYAALLLPNSRAESVCGMDVHLCLCRQDRGGKATIRPNVVDAEAFDVENRLPLIYGSDSDMLSKSILGVVIGSKGIVVFVVPVDTLKITNYFNSSDFEFKRWFLILVKKYLVCDMNHCKLCHTEVRKLDELQPKIKLLTIGIHSLQIQTI
jgi:hypothetical protein